jgi:hypothetical protein
MGKSTGNKTVIKKGTQTIGEVTNIGALSIATDSIETTTLADEFRTFMPGLSDAGEITLSGHYTGGDTGQNAIKTAQEDKTTEAYSVVYPTAIGKTWSFNAFVTNFTISEATNDDPIGFEITLKISGEPTLAATV